MSSFDEYARYDGLGLAELIRSRQVSPGEVLESAIRRIETYNPALNAVIHKLYDSARETSKKPLADGPFSGVPFLMKDLLATLEGVPTSAGNRLLRNIPARCDSELARRWKSAGLVILGKTNTPEFGLTPYTESRTFGPARNPWDVSRTPGGSSGGSAAAVAARMVPIASGGDGGGSIRIPASACGLFGLKPTRGRTPSGPQIGEAWNGFAIEHVLTRSVRDSAALLDVTAGADVGAPYYAPPQAYPFLQEAATPPGRLRIAWTSRPLLGKNVHPDVLRGLDDTLHLLESLGHQLEESAPPVDAEAFGLAFVTILSAELRADIEEAASLAGKRMNSADYDLTSLGMGLLGKALSASDYARANRTLQSAAREIGSFFEKFDILLTPTLSQPPVPIGALLPSPAEQALIGVLARFDAGWLLNLLGVVGPIAAQTFEFIPWTPVFNVTGQPAMSVPLYWNAENLPIGMHFVGRFGDEVRLFRLAGQLEQARPWADKIPPGYA